MGIEGELEVAFISGKQAEVALATINQSSAHAMKTASMKLRLAECSIVEDLPGLYFYGASDVAVVGNAHVLEALIEIGVSLLPVVVLSSQIDELRAWIEHTV